MKLQYDNKADAVYITLRQAEEKKKKKVDTNTILDYDNKGQIIGIELLFVTENNPDLIKEISAEQTA